MEISQKIKFGILGGGYSNERDISLKSAKAVNNALIKKGYNSSILNIENKQKLLSKDTYKNFDFIFILIHGLGGEDGELQNFLDESKINFSGSGAEACKKTFNKTLAKSYLPKSIITPKQFTWDFDQKTIYKNDKTVKKIVVKPVNEGSSIGVSIVENKQEYVKAAVEKTLKYGEFMLEEYISGKEITVAQVGKEIFPAIEIIPDDNFYDFKAKYNSNDTKYIEATYSSSRQKKLNEYISSINKEFGCKGWSRTDLIDDGENFYFLELNTVPGMTSTSLVPKAAKYAGYEFDQLVLKIINDSLD